MNWNFVKRLFKMLKLHSKDTLPQTRAVFQALVEAIVPNTPELAEKQGPLQSFSAVDLHTDEYVIWILDHYLTLNVLLKNFNIYLANTTAEMLNIAARQLICNGGNKKPINPLIVSDKGIFAALEAVDRYRTIKLLEGLEVDLASLPIPFRNNSDFVLLVTSVLTLLTANGYYSEWSGYGSTRLELPDKRKLEHFPTCWKQVGYPGYSMGYHALRGYLIDSFKE